MAALADPHPIEIVNLRHLRGSDLEPLLEEEIRVWRRRLHWDFSSSADLVRRYVEMHALSGFAIWSGSRIEGYSYYVLEEQKALVGDLFLLDSLASPEIEHRLLEAVFGELVDAAGARRIEAQLMMMRWMPDAARMGRRFRGLDSRAFERQFMLADLDGVDSLPQRVMLPDIEFRTWDASANDDAAHLIAACYDGHIDSRINDQYHSASGTRKFLTNIVLYPGCGHFFEPGSFTAWDRRTGEMLGLSLASLVAHETGHITQVCVAPRAQSIGLGYELLRRSLTQLATHGCREASLTVTTENRSAAQLYERMGFRVLRDFSAHVWDWR